jgi:hypothetical protein
MIINCEATPLVSNADALALDSKLADYFVNSVGHLTWMLNEADANSSNWLITPP